MNGEQPTFYLTAFEQLASFQREIISPAGVLVWRPSEKTVGEVTEFLQSAYAHDLAEPSLKLGIDGSISVIWFEKAWYISADFSNAAYIYAISRVPDKNHPGVLKCGHSKTNDVCPLMVEYVKLVYLEKAEQS